MNSILTMSCEQDELETIRTALEQRLCMLQDGQSADEAALGCEWCEQERNRIRTILHRLPRLI